MFPLTQISLYSYLSHGKGKRQNNGERKMFKKILMNEVRDALGRNPTDEEFKGFEDYVNDALLEAERLGKLDKVFLTNVSLWVIEYLKDNYKQCPECGEYFEINGDEWNCDRECCRNCHDYDDVADYKYGDSVCDQVMGC
jgi:hypothetical protein